MSATSFEVGGPAADSSTQTKNGFCWAHISLGTTCPFGAACKRLHLSLSQYERLVRGQQSGQSSRDMQAEAEAIAQTDTDEERDRKLYAQLWVGLRKTRRCHSFRDNGSICEWGALCVFVHMAGVDAWALLDLANSHKRCAYEQYLGQCCQSVCFFKHLHRENQPLKHDMTFFQSKHVKEQAWADGMSIDLIDFNDDPIISTTPAASAQAGENFADWQRQQLQRKETELHTPAICDDTRRFEVPRFCWSGLIKEDCVSGQDCNFKHLSHAELSKFIAAKLHPDAHVDSEAAEVFRKETSWKISLDLRKTRFCAAFQRGECDEGEDCIDVHVVGEDAQAVLEAANVKKICPYEKMLGFCPASKCPLRHREQRLLSDLEELPPRNPRALLDLGNLKTWPAPSPYIHKKYFKDDAHSTSSFDKYKHNVDGSRALAAANWRRPAQSTSAGASATAPSGPGVWRSPRVQVQIKQSVPHLLDWNSDDE